MAKKAQIFVAEINRSLKTADRGENALDAAVMLSIRHAVCYTTPDMLNNINRHLVANGHVQFAKRYREYVSQVSAWVYADKADSFKYRKAVAENWEDHADAWNARLGESWRIKQDAEEKAKKRRGLDKRVETALTAVKKEGHIPASEKANALGMLVSEMTNKQIIEALGDRFDSIIATAYPQPKAA